MLLVNSHYVSDYIIPYQILCDFDGTISLKDTTDYLLQAFAHPSWEDIEAQWARGEINSKVCMQKQIGLLDVSRDELHHCLDHIEIDLGFIELVQIAAAHHIPLIVVSDGLDYVIRYILKRYQLDHLPIIANHLSQVSERTWQLEFPNASSRCVSQSGTCKCNVAQQNQGKQSILIGDGRSDFCLAAHADYVFAKKSLIEHCKTHHIRHTTFNRFEEIYHPLTKLLNSDLGQDNPMMVTI